MTAHDRAPAFLTVDLDAIIANWRLLGARTPQAETAGVIKADAYGLGAIPVARALHGAGCRSFFVATIDEALEIRPHVGDARIFVLGGVLPGCAPEFIRNKLIPVLNSMDQVGLWAGFARALGDSLDAAVHLDTGMSRLGLEARDVDLLAERPHLLNGVNPVLVMSHMACADEPEHGKNIEQLTAFQALTMRLGIQAPLSLAASSTLFLGPEYVFDLTRPGLALYGANPAPADLNPMRPVVRAQGRILQVREVDAAQTVGYGATHQFKKKARLATIALGYADGVFRSLGNRASGIIGGIEVPLVGRVSMDLTVFDVSAASPDIAHPGALIDLIGPGRDIDQVAADAGTIAYEILTALGKRYHRIYIGGEA